MCECAGERSVCVISLSNFGCFHMNSCFPSSPLVTQPPSAIHTLQRVHAHCAKFSETVCKHIIGTIV